MKKATKINLTLLALLLSANGLYAQQGFGTNQPSKAAVIDMQSESKGLLIPRVSLTSLSVFLPVKGETATNVGKTNSLLVYNTATVGATIKPGYYYWTTDGTTPNSSWKRLLSNDDASALVLAGDVTGTLGATVVGRIQGTPVTNTVPTTNQVLTYNGTAWTPTAITPGTISGKADLSVTDGIRIATGSGTGALLNAATVGIADRGIAPIKITPGTNGQVLTTNSSGTTIWADKSSLITGVSNTSTNNLLSTTVNGITGATVNIINSNALTLNASNELVSTVNGVPSTSLDLTPAIKANQQNTIVQGTGAITVPTAVVSGNNSTYTVGVATATSSDLGVVRPGTGLSINSGILSVDATSTGIGKALTGSGITVTAGSTVGTGTSLANTVLADVTLGIADNAINSNKITNGSIQAEDLNTNIAGNGLAISGNALQVNAQNGINVNNDLVKLGGALTESTTITQSSYPLTIATGGTALTISGLPTGVTADKALVATSTGVVKQVRQAPRFFYMPAVIFDTSANGTNLTRNLYDEYVKQFQGGQAGAGNATYNIAHGTAGYSMPYNGGIVGSTGAPADIPVYTSGELYYYITYYDTAVFSNLSINASGELTYSIISNASNVSYMNIVFVVKE